MAELKVPNLCGATAEFNAIQDKFESLISDAVDSLESEASALASSATSAFNALESDLRSLIPESPALPDINLQAQITSLSGQIPGSAQHITLLANITTKFGSALTAGGFSLGTLVSDAKSAITGGTDLCSAVPNFTVPAAGGDAVEKAIESKQATKDSVEEKLSTLVKNANFTAAKTAVETAVKKMQSEGDSTDVDVVKQSKLYFSSSTPINSNNNVVYNVVTGGIFAATGDFGSSLKSSILGEYDESVFADYDYFLNGQKVYSGGGIGVSSATEGTAFIPAFGVGTTYGGVVTTENKDKFKYTAYRKTVRTHSITGSDPDVFSDTGFIEGRNNFYINGMQELQKEYLELYSGVNIIKRGLSAVISGESMENLTVENILL